VSCGTYPHPPGTAPHEHPEGLVSDEAVEDDREPGPLRVMWRKNHKVITPFMAAPVADLTAISGHFVTTGWFNHMLATMAAGLIAETASEIRNARGKRRHAVKVTARKAVAAGTVWAGVATMWSPWGGWEAMVQWPLIGGLVWAGVHNHKNKAKPVAEPEQPALPPPDDPRLVSFRQRFCEGPNPPLRDAWVGNFADLARGFSLEVHFHEDSSHSIAEVTGLIKLIALRFDTSIDKVDVGYVPEHKSEARAKVIVQSRLRPEVTLPTVLHRWDGKSTYNPLTGMCDLGGFVDDLTTHYQFHMPRSGASLGFYAGSMGSGKTGTLHVLGCEAGLAKLCTQCGAEETCPVCDVQRMIAVWMGDAQAHPLGIWRGKADLVGWGPEGCVELMQLADATAAYRSDALANLPWTDRGPDGKVRHNTGKGWFDPEPGFPLIYLPIDEWPLLVNHEDKELAKEAVTLAVRGVTTWRKVGIHLAFGTQIMDISQTGVRELRDLVKFFNIIGHRCDEVSSQMSGIKGDPKKLPHNEPGSGYISGPDDRSATQFRTKLCPEHSHAGDKGVDVRHLVEIISRTPIAYDSSVTRAMEAFGLKHQDVITEWKGRGTAEVAAEPAAAAGAAKGPGIYGLPFRDDAEKVKKALTENPGASMHRLMEVTGLPLGPVDQSLDVLIHNQEVVRTGDDQYTAA
jgi:hypothetical protein